MTNRRSLLAALALATAAALSPATAAPTVYFGEDPGAGSAAGLSTSNSARDQFVNHVNNLLGAPLGVEDFETLPVGTEFFGNPAARLDFVGGGVTASLSGGLVRNAPYNARFAVSGQQYLDTSFNQRIVFDKPVVAFGLYVIDANELNNDPATVTVGGQTLTPQQIDARPFDSVDGIFRIVAVRDSGQFEVLFDGGSFPARDSSGMFVGLVDAANPFIDIRLINGASGLDQQFQDGFGYDLMYAAAPVPEPASWLMLALGLAAATAWRRRGGAARSRRPAGPSCTG
jgi:hypothetical protein